jgi:hypothetical protein
MNCRLGSWRRRAPPSPIIPCRFPNAELSASTNDSGVVAIAGFLPCVHRRPRSRACLRKNIQVKPVRPAALQPLSTLGRPG